MRPRKDWTGEIVAGLLVLERVRRDDVAELDEYSCRCQRCNALLSMKTIQLKKTLHGCGCQVTKGSNLFVQTRQSEQAAQLQERKIEPILSKEQGLRVIDIRAWGPPKDGVPRKLGGIGTCTLVLSGKYPVYNCIIGRSGSGAYFISLPKDNFSQKTCMGLPEDEYRCLSTLVKLAWEALYPAKELV